MMSHWPTLQLSDRLNIELCHTDLLYHSLIGWIHFNKELMDQSGLELTRALCIDEKYLISLRSFLINLWTSKSTCIVASVHLHVLVILISPIILQISNFVFVTDSSSRNPVKRVFLNRNNLKNSGIQVGCQICLILACCFPEIVHKHAKSVRKCS